MYPGRNKASDGTIGDEAHRLQGNASDHNPWITDSNGLGVVTALDITHDPENGPDIDKLSDQLVASRDPRIKYVIANGLIAGPYTDWQWVENTGHYDHVHISVNTDNYDDETEWKIGEETMNKEAVTFAFRLGWNREPDQNELNYWVGKKPDELLKAIYYSNHDFRYSAIHYADVQKHVGELQRALDTANQALKNAQGSGATNTAELEKIRKENTELLKKYTELLAKDKAEDDLADKAFGAVGKILTKYMEKK